MTIIGLSGSRDEGFIVRKLEFVDYLQALG